MMKTIYILAVGILLAAYPAQYVHAQSSLRPLIFAQPPAFGQVTSQVKALQTFLVEQGFLGYTKITGYFGVTTQAAVVAFQRANGIDPIGIVGPMTRKKIAELTQPSEVGAPVIVFATSTPSPSIATSSVIRRQSRPPQIDRAAPTVPLNLSTSSVSQTSLSVVWEPSTDSGGSGLSFYELERCQGSSCSSFALINNASGASFIDSGLATNTPYRYRVRSVDGRGNRSDYSSILQVTTLPPQMYTLTVTKTGAGTGTVTSNPAGINCGSTCVMTFEAGTVINLGTISINFGGWSGACSGTGACSVTLTSDMTVSAFFASIFDA